MQAFTHTPRTGAPRRSLLQRCLPALGAALLGVTSAFSAWANTDTISATGASTWTVPANVSAVQIVATGGGGGGATHGPSSGGNGGQVTASIVVSPGQVLSLFVGGGGGSGSFGPNDGGGGGGSTTVNAGTANQIIAGGGGGGGFNGPRGGDGNGSAGASPVAGLGGGGGSNGGGGGGGSGSGGYPGGSGGSGNGGAGGNGSNAAGGIGAGSGTGGNNNSSYGGGGGGGYGGGGAGSDDNTQGGGGGGGGSVGPAGSSIGVGSNGGVNGAGGGGGSITISYTVASVNLPQPLASLPGVPNVGQQLTVLDLSTGNGPAMTTCLLNALKQMFGSDATYLGQAASGVVRISLAGQVISFYPLAATSSAASSIGITLGGGSTLGVGTSCTTFTVAPAVANVQELGTALTAMGLSVQINSQGVITAMVNGTLYAVRPDYFVTHGTATGTASIAFGSDGVLRFTDSTGHVQILRPAFLDPASLQNIMSVALGGTLTIQADGSGIFTQINGQQLLLTPDMQLSAAAAGTNSANWVNDKANHYLYRTGASYQGLKAVAR